MNNLIEFLKNNFHYFLFAVLLVLCLLLMGKSMSYSHYKFARVCQAVTGPASQGRSRRAGRKWCTPSVSVRRTRTWCNRT